MDRDWVKSHGSIAAFEILGDYQGKIDDGYSIDF
jgi:hypothetical protein